MDEAAVTNRRKAMKRKNERMVPFYLVAARKLKKSELKRFILGSWKAPKLEDERAS
jgi:hypothetical protein